MKPSVRLFTFLLAGHSIFFFASIGFARAQAARGAVFVEPAPLDLERVYRKRHALIIGIDEYKAPVPRLGYAVRDAEAVRDVLVGLYGFRPENVTLLRNGEATQRKIELALADLEDPHLVGDQDCVLIYFAGHGATVKLPMGEEMGFLIPSDAKVDLGNSSNTSSYSRSCLRMDSIRGSLAMIPAKHVLLLADACFARLMGRDRGFEPLPATTLSLLARLPARQVMSAGGKGQPSREDPRLGHGAFTYKLLQQLRARAAGGVFRTLDIYTALQAAVPALTNGRQTPYLDDYATEGQFLFIPSGAPARVRANPPLARASSSPGTHASAPGSTRGRASSGAAKGKEGIQDHGIAATVPVTGSATTDVLQLLPVHLSMTGGWRFAGGSLLTPPYSGSGGGADGGLSEFVLPCRAPAQYQMRLMVERLTDQGLGINIGFVAGGHQGMLVVDGYGHGSAATALEMLDGKRGIDNNTVRAGRRLKVGKRSTIVLSVLPGRILATCDGETVVDWRGDVARFSLHPMWAVPDRSALVFGSQGQFAIHELTLRKL